MSGLKLAEVDDGTQPTGMIPKKISIFFYCFPLMNDDMLMSAIT